VSRRRSIIAIICAFVVGAISSAALNSLAFNERRQSSSLNSALASPTAEYAGGVPDAATSKDLSDFRAAALNRKFPSVLVLNRASGKFVDQLAVAQKIYDLSFVVYRPEFATAIGLPEDSFYIDDSLPPEIKAVEISIAADHFKPSCELKVVVDRTSDVGSPENSWITDTTMRGDDMRFPTSGGESSARNWMYPEEANLPSVRYDSYISVGPFASAKDENKLDYASIMLVEYSSSYLPKTKYFRFSLGCEGLITRMIDAALVAGVTPILTMRRSAAADRSAPSIRDPERSYLSIPLPSKLLRRALSWLKEAMVQLPAIKGDTPDAFSSYPLNLRGILPPARLIERFNVE
jgi:hypothetical protein